MSADPKTDLCDITLPLQSTETHNQGEGIGSNRAIIDNYIQCHLALNNYELAIMTIISDHTRRENRAYYG